MFAGFDLNINKTFFANITDSSFEYYRKKGECHLGALKAKYKDNIQAYILDDIVNGTKVQSDWFPEVKADIFISHSHIDEDLANAFAGWLNDTFGLRCFIDSNVWGYADDLLEMLNDKYSNKRSDPNGGYLYTHEYCNKVSQHVNMMLNIALQKMIDRVESVFLLNTGNSIHIADSDTTISTTYSPWLYSEIVCSEIVRKKPLSAYRLQPILEFAHEAKEEFRADSSLTVSYDISTEHLVKINAVILNEWYNFFMHKAENYPLDILYKKLDLLK